MSAHCCKYKPYHVDSFSIQSLNEDLQDQRSSRDYILKTGSDLIGKAPSSERAARLEADLHMLNNKWNTVCVAMETRINDLETAIEQLKEYEVGVFKSYSYKCYFVELKN